MNLKEYTNEEIRNNVNDIVLLEITFKNEYEIKHPEIIKVTEKTFKTSNLGGRTVRFADVGCFSYRSGFFMEKDVEYVIGAYQRHSIDALKRQIEEAEKQIKRINELKRAN